MAFAPCVHCDHQSCGGARRHEKLSSAKYEPGHTFYVFVTYICTNCTTTGKVFRPEGGTLHTDRRCWPLHENLPGTHFRRTNFKTSLRSDRRRQLRAFLAVRRAAQATNASSEQIELLEKARSQRQSIEILRDVAAIPAVLLTDGRNPLTLPHDLLSDGIHELDDEECLVRAREAEVILCEIPNRMQIALTERKTVKDALGSILNRKAGKDAVAKAIEPQRS